MNDKYDVQGCVHKLEQRKTWNIGLEHLPNRDSLDVEFSPSGQILRLATYNMAGVLIGSEHFVYSDSGKISQRTEWNRIETTSETEGKFIGRTVEVYDGGLLLSFASYDDNNLLKREKIFKYVGKKLQTADSRFYIPDGTLVEQIAFGLWWADPVAALIMVPIIAKEGVEALQGKACDECHA